MNAFVLWILSQRVKRPHLSLIQQSTWLSFHLRYKKKFDWIVSHIKSFSQCWDFAYQKKVVCFVKIRTIAFSPKRLLSRKWLEILSWFNMYCFSCFLWNTKCSTINQLYKANSGKMYIKGQSFSTKSAESTDKWRLEISFSNFSFCKDF